MEAFTSCDASAATEKTTRWPSRLANAHGVDGLKTRIMKMNKYTDGLHTFEAIQLLPESNNEFEIKAFLEERNLTPCLLEWSMYPGFFNYYHFMTFNTTVGLKTAFLGDYLVCYGDYFYVYNKFLFESRFTLIAEEEEDDE